MSVLFTPAHTPLTNPVSGQRTLRRPDLRHLIRPRLSATPLSDEVVWDDLIVHRAYRSYEPDASGQVRYFMYELSQKNPGEDEYTYFWKAVRFIRLTRVPRYLRQAGGMGGPGLVFDQQRDLLAALREQQVLFINLIAKSPNLPLVFAYGVQAVGRTPEEAQENADMSYAVLSAQLDGTYQQLEYQPLTLQEGELLSRYQVEWDQLAMARGRPLPTGGSLGGAGMLDGNRTDVESTNNQLESFIRGLGDRSFMLSMVTVPVSPAEITLAWRNMAQKLSEVRSDQQGARSLQAGVALPLGMGSTMGDSWGNTHSVGQTIGTGASEGASQSVADSVSRTDTVGVSSAETSSVAYTQGTSLSRTESVTDSVSVAYTQGTNASVGQSVSLSEAFSVGTTQSQSATVTAGQSLSAGQSATASWNSSISDSFNSTVSEMQSWSQSNAESLSQALSNSFSQGEGSNFGTSNTESNDLRGGVPGVGGSMSASTGQNAGGSNNTTFGVGNTLTGGSTFSNGIGASMTNTLGRGLTMSESFGGSLSNSITQGVSTSQSLSVGESLSQTLSQGRTLGASQSFGVSESITQSAGRSIGVGITQGVSESVTQGRAITQGQSTSVADQVGRTVSDGVSAGVSQNQSLADAYMVAMSRTASQTGSLGVVPNFGVAITRQTFDESKRVIGDVLEAQMNRYVEGVEGGAYLYQMFLVCPDAQTLAGASGLLRSAFWGPGDAKRLPQPFHTVVPRNTEERRRLLQHAQAFTSYRHREPNVELVEPFWYSTYTTLGELATFCHPPTAEASGLLAVHDSMPVMAMPANREHREVYLGRVINGERARVSDLRFGVDLSELTHTLIAGSTGSGKTTTLMRMLTEASRVSRTLIERGEPGSVAVRERTVHASVLAFDWMPQMRRLASVVEPERFQFFSIRRPELGQFRFNVLALPDASMNPSEWLSAQADNFVASMNLGEYGRSLIAELLGDLYAANRLEPFVLRPAVVAEDGTELRAAVVLAPVSASLLPAGAIATDASGRRYANVYTFPELSRLVDISHLATLVVARIEQLGTDTKLRAMVGSEAANRLQSLWRRMQYYTPDQPLGQMLAGDPSLEERETLGVSDLIDPDRGMVTVIESDGLGIADRRLILGSVMLAVFRYGLHHGSGVFDHKGKGPGCFVVLEEAHELLGEGSVGEDTFSAQTRTELWESMFRRSRALGMRLIAVAQNPGQLPEAVTSNTSTVLLHRLYAKADRDRAFSLLNWNNQIAQQQREYRYLGEMPVGYCIARLDAKTSFLESAPIHIHTDDPGLPELDDVDLAALLADSR
jgi:DNA helicase HerA-like ATPase